MKLFTLLSLLLLVGCTANPRYRTGGEERLQQIEETLESKYTTNDYLRLGMILQDYLGKPYKGMSKYEEGVDCSHFTQSVFKKFDRTIELPRTAADQFKTGREIPYSLLYYGDLLFFRTEGRKISHVGIFVGDESFIHASSSNGVIISSLNEKYWAERFAGARRILD
ncbi:MAG: C40 family peptidase [Candidatus Zixiibacteriota bacterium]